jgi:hypothetical protein
LNAFLPDGQSRIGNVGPRMQRRPGDEVKSFEEKLTIRRPQGRQTQRNTAAAPEREEQGMLIGRFTLVLAATGLGALSTPVLAQGSLPDQLAVCARISKKDARLECYDSIAAAAGQGSFSSGFGASSIRSPQSAPPSSAAPGAGTGFGAEQIDRPLSERRADDGADEIDVAVAASSDNGLGMWQFNLADGAVWRMSERVSNFRPPAPNEMVTIRKGALGSYLMQVGRQAAVRVVRVR